MIKDMVDIQSSIYGYCTLESLYNSFAVVLSDEGLAQLVGRTFFGTIYEFPADIHYVLNP